MTRWLVTGSGGMLGQDLAAALDGRKLTALNRDALDITDAAAVHAAVPGHNVVINVAAWIDVDGAETAEADATRVNGEGVANLARACGSTGAILLHVSTDAVFSGNANRPYLEDALTGPINAYGRSKLAGEHAVRLLLPERGYIVRSCWLYGRGGRNFVATVLGRARQDSAPVSVVADQWGQPTWTQPLARWLVELGEMAHDGQASSGIYHASASGEATRFDLAVASYELAGLDPERIKPISMSDYQRAAPQGRYNVLAHGAGGPSPLNHWRPMLEAAFEAGIFDEVLR